MKFFRYILLAGFASSSFAALGTSVNKLNTGTSTYSWSDSITILDADKTEMDINITDANLGAFRSKIWKTSRSEGSHLVIGSIFDDPKIKSVSSTVGMNTDSYKSTYTTVKYINNGKIESVPHLINLPIVQFTSPFRIGALFSFSVQAAEVDDQILENAQSTFTSKKPNSKTHTVDSILPVYKMRLIGGSGNDPSILLRLGSVQCDTMQAGDYIGNAASCNHIGTSFGLNMFFVPGSVASSATTKVNKDNKPYEKVGFLRFGSLDNVMDDAKLSQMDVNSLAKYEQGKHFSLSFPPGLKAGAYQAILLVGIKAD